MSGNAYLSKPVVYWLNTINGDIKMGLPDNYPAPPYHEKIVCNTVWDVDHWSQKMREQERVRQQMDDDKRGAIEERMRGEIRSHMHHLMANSRNNMNRDFLRRYIEKSDRLPNDPTRWNRESFLHIEGYEDKR